MIRRELSLVLSISLLSGILVSAQSTLYVPTYGTSANGFQSPPRGYNTFGLQAASSTLQSEAGFVFDDAHIREQCGAIQTESGFDYVCSIDSGWSEGCSGDDNGVFTPDASVIPNITDLGSFLHSKGLKLGVYILPGAFSADSAKAVKGTNITLGSLFDTTQASYNCREAFVYEEDGVQQFHDSVIQTFVSWGVDFIKLDYMRPGSPDAGEALPANSSGAAIAYHNAIKSSGSNIRLDISWKLNRTDPFWSIWQSSSDSLRVDQDINNSGQDTLSSWMTVLRSLDFYRQFINEQTVATRQGQAIQIHPDMDNTYIGNPSTVSGLSDVQRYTMAEHWIGAGANLISGSDLTHLDPLGMELLYNTEAMDVAAFTAQYPMQPRNPLGSTTVGGNAAEQLQAWIAGPNSTTAVVILANYGPDPCLSGGCTPTYGTSLSDTQLVNITLTDLGIGGASWSVRRVWGGGGAGGPDHSTIGVTDQVMASNLGPGESAFYRIAVPFQNHLHWKPLSPSLYHPLSIQLIPKAKQKMAEKRLTPAPTTQFPGSFAPDLRTDHRKEATSKALRDRAWIYLIDGWTDVGIWKSAFIECIGTLSLCYVSATIHTTLLTFQTPQVAAYVGITNIVLITLFIYALAPASGGHLNPMITAATMANGLTGFSRGMLYLLGQLIGAAVAGGLIRGSFGGLTGVVLAFGVGLDPRQAQVFGPKLGPFLTGCSLGLVSFSSIGLATGYPGAGLHPGRCFAFAVARGDFRLWLTLIERVKMADDPYRTPASGPSDSHQIDHQSSFVYGSLFSGNYDNSAIDPSLRPDAPTATQGSVGNNHHYSFVGPHYQAGNTPFEDHPGGYGGFHYGAPDFPDGYQYFSNDGLDIDHLNRGFDPTPPAYTGPNFDNIVNSINLTSDGAEHGVPQPLANGGLDLNNTATDREVKFVTFEREIRPRTIYSHTELCHLKAAWRINRNPTGNEKQRLANLLGKTRKVIDTWFSHRRREAKSKKRSRYSDLYPENQVVNTERPLLPVPPAVAPPAIKSPGLMNSPNGSIHSSTTPGFIASDPPYVDYCSSLLASAGTKAAHGSQPLNNGPGNAAHSQLVKAQLSESSPNNLHSAPVDTEYAKDYAINTSFSTSANQGFTAAVTAVHQAKITPQEQARLAQLNYMESHLDQLREKSRNYLPSADFRWENGEAIWQSMDKEQQRLVDYYRYFDDIARLESVLAVHRGITLISS
ncbi:hypothetical protein B7494_g720 [Chlorociboria aeruginascens]|nr:hypothetical protein B7494_g720 [Chlorociboria aeruginascens]